MLFSSQRVVKTRDKGHCGVWLCKRMFENEERGRKVNLARPRAPDWDSENDEKGDQDVHDVDGEAGPCPTGICDAAVAEAQQLICNVLLVCLHLNLNRV